LGTAAGGPTGRAVITCLARLGGKVVGVIAYNPTHGGVVDVKAARKQSYFTELCDNFKIAWPSAERGSLPIEGGVKAAFRRAIEAVWPGMRTRLGPKSRLGVRP